MERATEEPPVGMTLRDLGPAGRLYANGRWVGLPFNEWAAWTGLLALPAALVLAVVGGLIVDIPLLAFGVKIAASPTPPGVELLNTIVQDTMFVLTAAMFARIGGRTVRSWQLGYRPARLWRAVGLVLLTLFAFLVFSEIWTLVLNETAEDKLLEKLGGNETSLLLAGSALLTTVIAPIAEETLFRGYIFPALSKWKGWLVGALLTAVLFGGVHYGSAPTIDLVPLGALGFALCLLYRRTGSLYPGIVAHSLNNSLAFAGLEHWSWWQAILLMAGAPLVIGAVALAFRRVGLISRLPFAPAAANGSG